MAASVLYSFFFFQAEDGIRDYKVTGVQTCALPICHVAQHRQRGAAAAGHGRGRRHAHRADRKSTRLNSSHLVISYAVFCLKKKNNTRPVRSVPSLFARCLLSTSSASVTECSYQSTT